MNIFVLFLFYKAELEQGPTKQELLNLLKNCDLAGASCSNSIVSSRTPSPSPSLLSIMYPGFKQTNIVSRIGTPISTPIMQHPSGQTIDIQPHYYNESGDPAALRMSGLFTGSNLSLNTETPPAASQGNNHETNNHKNTEPCEDDKNEASSPTIYRNGTDIPERPMSSSDVLEADKGHDTDPYLLRRVYSDTTPPVAKRNKRTKPSVNQRYLFSDEQQHTVNTNADTSSPQVSSPLEPGHELDVPSQTNESTLI